jgi:putative copper export protein
MTTASTPCNTRTVLTPTLATVRLFLHVLSASIWVGGQFTMAGLVPGLRAINPELPRTVASRFGKIAWPAFAVAVATGIWNVVAIKIGDTSTSYQVTLGIKLLVVAISGMAAAAHSLSRSKVVLAVGGALAGLSGLAALFFGVLLAQ